MNQSDILQLEQIVDEKINLLGEYGRLTDRVAAADIDSAADILDQRQNIINEVDRLTEEAKAITKKQSEPYRIMLKGMLSFLSVPDCTADLLPLSEKIGKLKEHFITLSEKEKNASAHLAELRTSLLKDMERSNQDRKIMNFMNSTTSVELFHGKELDENG